MAKKLSKKEQAKLWSYGVDEAFMLYDYHKKELLADEETFTEWINELTYYRSENDQDLISRIKLALITHNKKALTDILINVF